MDYDTTTALVVVDVQNDFVDPAGSLAVPGAAAALDAVNLEVRRARAAGAAVVATQDWHPARTPHFKVDGGVWPVHCVAGTWGAELHPALNLGGDHPVVRKGAGGEDGYSGFSVRHPRRGDTAPTELEELLRGREVERVVVVGVATDYCVKETALDATRLGFATALVLEAVAAVDLHPGDGEAALAAMAAAGVTLT